MSDAERSDTEPLEADVEVENNEAEANNQV